MCRTDAGVDVEAIGLGPDRDYVGAELVEHRWRNVIGGAMRAIDDDAPAVRSSSDGNVLLQNST